MLKLVQKFNVSQCAVLHWRILSLMSHILIVIFCYFGIQGHMTHLTLPIEILRFPDMFSTICLEIFNLPAGSNFIYGSNFIFASSLGVSSCSIKRSKCLLTLGSRSLAHLVPSIKYSKSTPIMMGISSKLREIDQNLWHISSSLSMFSLPNYYVFKHNISLDSELNDLIELEFSNLIEDGKFDPLGSGLENLFALNFKKCSGKQQEVLYEVCYRLTAILQSIGTKNGFVSNFNLFDSSVYPLIHTIAANYLDWEYGLKDKKDVENNKQVISERMGNPEGFLKDLVERYTLKWISLYYGWLINICILGLYSVSQKILGSNPTLVTKSNFQGLTKRLYSYLDLDIRRHFEKKSATIIQNIHSGFDSEYQQVHSMSYLNKPLSYQIAVTASLHLTVPKNVEYKPEGINPDTREVYKLSKFLPGMARPSIESLINHTILALRPIMFGDFDKKLACIVSSLKTRQTPYFESKSKYTFVFPYSDIKKQMLIPLVNDDGTIKNLNSTVLFKKIVSLVDTELYLMTDLLIKILTQDVELNLPSIDTSLINPNQESEGNLHKQQSLNKILNLEVPDSDCSWSIKGFLKGDLPKGNKLSDNSLLNDSKSFKVYGVRLRVVRRMSIYSHYNAAEWSLLDDFDTFKENLSIIHKSYTTMGGPRPLKIKGCDWPIYIRDTYLLAAPGYASLDNLGQMHGFPKGVLSKDELSNMEELKLNNYKKFKKYALQDSLISLIHGLFMERFMFTLKTNTIPLTLGGIASKYALNKWIASNYSGYQPNSEYLLSHTDTAITPKGINEIGLVGLYLNMYIAAYKGGLNETFEYGSEANTKFSDLDLSGCYTTIMGIIGNPDFSKASVLTTKDLNKMKDIEIAHSFLVIDTSFEWPHTISHPTIGMQVDKTLTGYLRKGRSTIMGSEYLVAKNLGCKLTVHNAFNIPFETVEPKIKNTGVDSKPVFVNKPFFDIIKELHSLRKANPKKSPLEQVYKNLGNSLYGLTGQGLSNKKNFDIKTKSMVTMKGSKLSSPLIAAFITGYVRSVIGELLNNTISIGGRIISVTTDGFITDVHDLEERLLANQSLNTFFLQQFRNSRKELGHPPDALETKTQIEGINAWTTRGQVGVIPHGTHKINIRAMTGYQAKNKNWSDLDSFVKRGLESPSKNTYFLRETLRAANDVYKQGGHVTIKYNEQKYSFSFDNKRQVILPDGDVMKTITKIDPSTGVSYLDFSDAILKTKPWANAESLLTSRFISRRLSSRIYAKNDFAGNLLPPLNKTLDLCIRALLRWYLMNKNYLPFLPIVIFMAKVMNKRLTTAFVERSYRYIALLKVEGNFIPNSVPNNHESRKFIDLAHKYLPEFYLNPIFSLEHHFLQKDILVLQPTRDRRDLLQTTISPHVVVPDQSKIEILEKPVPQPIPSPPLPSNIDILDDPSLDDPSLDDASLDQFIDPYDIYDDGDDNTDKVYDDHIEYLGNIYSKSIEKSIEKAVTPVIELTPSPPSNVAPAVAAVVVKPNSSPVAVAVVDDPVKTLTVITPPVSKIESNVVKPLIQKLESSGGSETETAIWVNKIAKDLPTDPQDPFYPFGPYFDPDNLNFDPPVVKDIPTTTKDIPITTKDGSKLKPKLGPKIKPTSPELETMVEKIEASPLKVENWTIKSSRPLDKYSPGQDTLDSWVKTLRKHPAAANSIKIWEENTGFWDPNKGWSRKGPWRNTFVKPKDFWDNKKGWIVKPGKKENGNER